MININKQQSLMDVSVNLLKSIDTTSENTLISPISISIALAMIANGADGMSTQRFKNFFGVNSIDELNETMKMISIGIPSEKPNQIMKIANSMWYNINSNIKLKEDFFNKTKSIYNAEIAGANFLENDKTAEKINKWVNKNTNEMIKDIVSPKDITKETQMILANTLLFDYKWQQQYDKYQVINENFKGQDETKEIEFMVSIEKSYLETEDMVGMQKAYEGGRYSFVGILPKKNVEISNFIKTLTSDNISALLRSETNEKTEVKLPKFDYDYNTSLKDSLISLGLRDEFDKNVANFRNMYNLINLNENIYIGDVLHKAHIELSESGTKATAVTTAMMAFTNCVQIEKYKNINFDKPFVYMIFDKEIQLPIFIGTIINVK